MPNTTCNFFAILKDDTVRKIDLLQTITADIRNVFVNIGNSILNDDVEEILFDEKKINNDSKIRSIHYKLFSYSSEPELQDVHKLINK